MKKLLLLIGVFFAALPVQKSFGQCQNSDAGQSTYNGGWTNGLNDNATGFGAWQLSAGAGAGFFTASSNNNDNGASGLPNINTSSRAWGMFSNSGNTANAVRTFFTPMAVGHAISYSMDNGGINNGATVGMSLQNASGQTLLELYFRGGQANYELNDGSGTNFSTGLGFTRGGIDVTITRNATGTYVASITRKESNTTFTSATRNFFSAFITDFVPAQIRFFNFNAGSGGAFDAFFNNLSLCRPTINPATTTFTAFSITYGTASSAQTVSVTGTKLFDNIIATAAANFEVSNGGAFGPTTTFIQSGGNASGTLSVRLAANASVSGSFNGTTAATLTSTGAITGTYTTAANGNTVTPKTLTFTGLSIPASKIYNGTTAGVVSGGPGSLQAAQAFNTGNSSDGKPYTGDAVSTTGTATGTYNTKDVATATTVSFSGITLTGAAAGNYSLTTHNSQAATITALGVVVTPDANQSKVFGAGNPTYTYTNSPSLISPDVFTGALSRISGEAVGTYAYTLGNLTAGNNYSLSQGGSNTFAITGINESIADFRSKSPGGNFSLASTWEYDLGGNNFTDASTAPSSTNNVSIVHDIILNQNFTVGSSKSLTIGTGGTLVVNPTRTLTITGTADFGGKTVTFQSNGTGTASLGQVSPAGLTGATNVTVERYIPNNGFRSWRLLSVPTSGSQTINAALQEGNAPLANGTPNYGTQITGPVAGGGLDAVSPVASMLSWNGTGFVGIANTNASIASNRSYFLYIRGERTQGITGGISNSSATTLRTTGTVYTGEQTFNVGSGNQFGLIANLYPSAIDLNSIGATGFTPRYYYIWDSKLQSGNSLGVYKTIDADGGFSVTGPSGGSYSGTNRIIESGQSFFVQTNNAVGTVTINEDAKIAGSINGFLGLRPSTPVAAVAKLRSTLISINGSSSVADENVVKFDNAYPNTVDEYDALKFSNAGENFGILRDSKTLVIEGRQPVSVADTIYYRMWNMQPHAYQFQFEPINLSGSGLTAVLEDKYLQKSTIVDLNIINSVNFTVDGNAGSSAADRFKIVFKQLAPLPVSILSISANRTSAGVKVSWKVAAERGIRSYEIVRSFDGRSFTAAGTVTATGNSAAELSYSSLDATAPATTIFYKVKSIGNNGEIKFSSIVKVSGGKVKAAISISPNPVEGAVVNLQLKNQPEGKYSVRILTNIGQVIMSNKMQHAGGNSTQLLTLPTGIAKGTYQLEVTLPDNTRQVQTLFISSSK